MLTTLPHSVLCGQISELENDNRQLYLGANPMNELTTNPTIVNELFGNPAMLN